MAHFLFRRMENPDMEKQQAVLGWMQILCHLGVTIPLDILFNMFTTGKDHIGVQRKIYFYFLFFYVRYSTLLHLPPLRFHCVGGCWDPTQDCFDFGIYSQTL
jgi:hypothetical protein